MEASSITTEIIQWATKIERTHSLSNILGEDSSLSAFKWSTAVDLSKVSISSLTLHWLANVWWYSIPCHIVCALPCRLEILRSRRYEAETKSISFGFSRAFGAIIPVDVIFASFSVAHGEKETHIWFTSCLFYCVWSCPAFLAAATNHYNGCLCH